MNFVSYAQNFEDVMLWRALGHVPNGTYVDVGAHHPISDSVSKGFYERGWRGIHIEPTPEYAELMRQDRPDEPVLQVALSDADGTLEFTVIPGTGLSTAVPAYAEHIRANHHRIEQCIEHVVIQVQAQTLASALTSLAGKDVHWLKIDVEGFEEQVLKGWDSKTLRPWVMVIEATLPGSPETNHTKWEPLVIEAGYRFVYFDGLNRFYVSPEHQELVETFSRPPNVFDGFHLSGLASASFCNRLIQQQEALRADMLQRQAATEAKCGNLEREVQLIYSSTSWRVTAPLRILRERYRRLESYIGARKN
jgi:FkbM family methyltransferase